MEQKRGMFIVFEGIDGCGKSTQMNKLFEYIGEKDKYIDIIKTHEPWRSKEIKKKINEDKEAYSDGFRMARLFVEESRIPHSVEIEVRLSGGYFVLCDRYKMSTCAYQWTQGVELFKLFKLHENPSIIHPDLTLFIDVSAEIAQERRDKRSAKKEKFEEWKFQKDLIAHYNSLISRADCSNLFGKVVEINGRGSVEEVFERVKGVFDPLYEKWNS